MAGPQFAIARDVGFELRAQGRFFLPSLAARPLTAVRSSFRRAHEMFGQIVGHAARIGFSL